MIRDFRFPLSYFEGEREVDEFGTTWKNKQQTSQFPLLEMHLLEWVGRANHKHIIVNGFFYDKSIIAVEELVVELSRLPNLMQMFHSNEAKTWVHADTVVLVLSTVGWNLGSRKSWQTNTARPSFLLLLLDSTHYYPLTPYAHHSPPPVTFLSTLSIGFIGS